MSAILFLIPAALALGFVALLAFVWATKSGQYDDLDGAANRILFDDDMPEKKPSEDKPHLAPSESEDK